MKMIAKENSKKFISLIGGNNFPLYLLENSSFSYEVKRALVNCRCALEDCINPRYYVPEDYKQISNTSYSDSVRHMNEVLRETKFYHHTQLIAATDTKLRREEDIVIELAKKFSYNITRVFEKNETQPKHQETQPEHQETHPKHQETHPEHQETHPKHQETHPKHQETHPKHKTVSLMDVKKQFIEIYCFPETISANNNIYKRIDTQYIQTSVGNFVAGLVFYENLESGIFYIPAHFEEHDFRCTGSMRRTCPHLIPGIDNSQQYLTNEEVLAKSSTDTIVLLCASPITARAINQVLTESKRDAVKRLIAVAPYAPIKKTDWRSLKGKIIHFIPDLARQSFYDVFEIEKKCSEADVKGFNVIVNPILSHFIQVEPDDVEKFADPFERHCVKNYICLDEHESVILLKIVAQSLSIAKYKTWGIEKGLWSDEVVDLDSTTDLKLSTAEAPMDHGNYIIGKPVICLDIFGAPKNVAVMISDPGVGKTPLAITVGLARAAGKDLLGMQGLQPGPVLYLDAEIPELDFRSKYQRCMTALGVGCALENFTYHCFRDDLVPATILDACTQKMIINKITEQKIKLLIIDNPISLVPHFRLSASKAWPKIWGWIRSLESMFPELGLLIVHHTNTEGKAAGTSDILTQCSTMFVLDSPRIKNSDAKEKEFGIYIHKKGALFRVTIVKARQYPQADKIKFGAFLPYDPNHPIEGGPWVRIDFDYECDQENTSEDSQNLSLVDTSSDMSYRENWQDRTDEERIILDLAVSENHGFSRKMVEKEFEQKNLKCGKTKAGNMLSKLVEDKLLDSIGRGRAIKYVLRK